MSNNSGLKTFLAIIGVLVVLGGGYYVMSGGQFPQGNIGGTTTVPTTGTTVTPSTPNVYTGLVNFDTVATQTTNGTAITLDTNADVVFFWKQPDGSYQRAGAQSDGSEGIVVGSNNIIYAEVTIPASQNFFVDVKTTQQRNPQIKSVEYTDPTFDGTPTYVFGWDISSVKAQGTQFFAPTATWSPMFIADQTFTMASASSLAGVGTGTKTSTIQSSISIDTNGGGEAFKAVQVRVNGTQSTNEVAEEQSYWTIPDASKSGGFDNLYLSQMSASYDYSGGTSIFRKDYSYTVNGANLITVPQVGSKQINIPFTVTTNMDGANDAVCVELRMEPISARNVAGTALVDDVEIAAPASQNAECSIT